MTKCEPITRKPVAFTSPDLGVPADDSLEWEPEMERARRMA